MKKILSTLAVVLCCAMTTTVHAQDKVEQALKLAEQNAKFADENVENGKVQYEAAISFISDDLGEKKDFPSLYTKPSPDTGRGRQFMHLVPKRPILS